MKGYAESRIFSKKARAMFFKAKHYVSLIEEKTDENGKERLRCHELVRIVANVIVFDPPSYEPFFIPPFVIVDGKYGHVDHSWIEIRERISEDVILDVYAPGQMPQVQMIDTAWVLPHKKIYVAGDQRDDIKWGTIHRHTEELKEKLRDG